MMVALDPVGRRRELPRRSFRCLLAPLEHRVCAVRASGDDVALALIDESATG
jgi:hypothetical protein